jgi:nitrite reductase (NADH) small subunit
MANMAERLLIGDLAQIPPGEGRTYEVAGRRVAVFHTRSGDVFATQANCPHLGGPLADGLVGGSTVICPLHDRVYDLRTGQGPESECGIEVYPVALADDGKIWIDLADTSALHNP